MQPSSAPRLTPGRVSSAEAYVLPHLVEIPPPHEGVVARVLVMERDVVAAGQHLVEIARGDERTVLTSPVNGVVSRCRFHAGDAATPARPLLSIVRADDVLVVARFDACAGAALRKGDVVQVRIPRATTHPVAATLVCVTGAHRCETSAGAGEDPAVRVVAKLHAAPPAALWPGIEAIVDAERVA